VSASPRLNYQFAVFTKDGEIQDIVLPLHYDLPLAFCMHMDIFQREPQAVFYGAAVEQVVDLLGALELIQCCWDKYQPSWAITDD
jgi:hypothetical protein